MGYSRAGFDEIVGVDNRPQPRYPFTFIQADAMTYPLEGFDAIHASPPCQGYSIMRNLPWLREKVYPLLIEPTRERLQASGVPWVIENVMGAKLPAYWLCGTMFGLPFYRHRFFESNFYWLRPSHAQHRFTVRNGRMLGARARDIVFGDKKARNAALRLETKQPTNEWGLPRLIEGVSDWARDTLSPVGHAAGGVARVKEAMQIDWMTRDEITQAIPPAYTEHVGRALLAVIAGFPRA